MSDYKIRIENTENGVITDHTIAGDTREQAITEFVARFPHWKILSEDEITESVIKKAKARSSQTKSTRPPRVDTTSSEFSPRTVRKAKTKVILISMMTVAVAILIYAYAVRDPWTIVSCLERNGSVSIYFDVRIISDKEGYVSFVDRSGNEKQIGGRYFIRGHHGVERLRELGFVGDYSSKGEPVGFLDGAQKLPGDLTKLLYYNYQKVIKDKDDDLIGVGQTIGFAGTEHERFPVTFMFAVPQ